LHTKFCTLQPLLLPPKIYEKTFVICGCGKMGGLRVGQEEGKRHALTLLHHEKVKKRNEG
jgi:hypothetical protein